MRTNNLRFILIVGSLPPPIGGVTIHIQRLLYHLKENGIRFKYVDLKRNSIFLILREFIRRDRIHIHTSNSYFRFFLIILGSFLFKTIDFTIHRDLGRDKSIFIRYIDLFSIKMANRPILLNEVSYKLALKYNINSFLGSSFLPPDLDTEFLPKELLNSLNVFKNRFKMLFCTNAYSFVYDKNGREIYGILEIIEIFRSFLDFGLIISDPSSSYRKICYEKNILLPTNILLISEPHSFYKILEFSDGSIRNTSTDGDSLSVKESLYLNKVTICTDVVSRPDGVVNYSLGNLDVTLNNLKKDSKQYYSNFNFNKSIKELLELYK